MKKDLLSRGILYLSKQVEENGIDARFKGALNDFHAAMETCVQRLTVNNALYKEIQQSGSSHKRIRGHRARTLPIALIYSSDRRVVSIPINHTIIDDIVVKI